MRDLFSLKAFKPSTKRPRLLKEMCEGYVKSTGR